MSNFAFFCCKCGTTTFSPKPLDRIFALWCCNKKCHELLVRDYQLLINAKESQPKQEQYYKRHSQIGLDDPNYYQDKYSKVKLVFRCTDCGMNFCSSELLRKHKLQVNIKPPIERRIVKYE